MNRMGDVVNEEVRGAAEILLGMRQESASSEGIMEDNGIYRANGQFPNKWLEELWAAISKTDIIKDQGKSYDPEIVKNIISGGCDFSGGYLRKTLTELGVSNTVLNNRYPLAKNTEANDSDKEHLWNSIVYENDTLSNKSYSRFNGLVDLNEGQIKVNGTDFIYNYKVLKRPTSDEKGDTEVFGFEDTKNIMDYMGEPFVKVTDVTKGGDVVIQNLSIEDIPNMIHAHTREMENDPAGKLNPDSGNAEMKKAIQKVFYYEPGAPMNAQTVVYSPYNSSTMIGKGKDLSHFYSSRLVSLTHNGVKDKKRKRLGVDFQFETSDGKMIKVEEGVNTAGALLKSKIMKCFDKTPAEQKKEAVFLSKHHGDVGQLLAYYRNIKLRHYSDNTVFDKLSSDYSFVFETYDMLAALKSLTIGVDSLWLYPAISDKKQMIIFKKIKSGEEYLKVQKKELKNIIDYCTPELIEEYNNNLEDFNNSKNIFIEIATRELDGILEEGAATVRDEQKKMIENYKKVLTKAAQIATLFAYIPTSTQETLFQIEEVNRDAPEETIEEVELKIKSFSTIHKNLKYYNNFKDWKSKVLSGDRLIDVNLSKEFIITPSSSLYSTKTKFNDFTSYINLLNYSSSTSLTESRMGPRFINSWALDLLLSLYSKLEANDKSLSKEFINKLKEVINKGTDEQKTTFTNALRMLGIVLEQDGGAKKRPREFSNGSTNSNESQLSQEEITQQADQPITQMSEGQTQSQEYGILSMEAEEADIDDSFYKNMYENVIDGIDRYYSVMNLVNELKMKEEIKALINIYIKYENTYNLTINTRVKGSYTPPRNGSSSRNRSGTGTVEQTPSRTILQTPGRTSSGQKSAVKPKSILLSPQRKEGGGKTRKNKMVKRRKTLKQKGGANGIPLELEIYNNLRIDMNIEEQKERLKKYVLGSNLTRGIVSQLEPPYDKSADELNKDVNIINKEENAYGFYYIPDYSYMNILRKLEDSVDDEYSKKHIADILDYIDNLENIYNNDEIEVENTGYLSNDITQWRGLNTSYSSSSESNTDTNTRKNVKTNEKNKEGMKGGRKTRKATPQIERVRRKLDGIKRTK